MPRYWLNSKGRECFEVGPKAACVCTHPLSVHFDRDTCDKCSCRQYRYLPASPLACYCKHDATQHNPITTGCQAKFCSCKKFITKWLCKCGQGYRQHKEVEKDRFQEGKLKLNERKSQQKKSLQKRNHEKKRHQQRSLQKKRQDTSPDNKKQVEQLKLVKKLIVNNKINPSVQEQQVEKLLDETEQLQKEGRQRQVLERANRRFKKDEVVPQVEFDKSYYYLATTPHQFRRVKVSAKEMPELLRRAYGEN